LNWSSTEEERLDEAKRGEGIMGSVSDKKTKKTMNHRKGSTGQVSDCPRGGELSSAGAKIVAAFQEAIDTMRTGETLERQFTVRTYKVEFTPRDYGPDDARRVRDLLGMSQVLFARFLGVDANTVRSWEQGTRPPSPIARRFMDEIESDPEYWRRRIVERAMSNETGKARSNR
jgi:DNA-binding transcriptional regulator YiaG